jgi:hypothetical protein
MKWMIWHRQYGKTYQVCQWFLEDPRNRVIITSNENLARIRRRDLESEQTGIFHAHWKRILKSHIVSFRSWQNMRGVFPPTIEIAIDGIDDMVSYLFHGDVKIITGAGVNERPDPGRAAKADDFHNWTIKHLGVDPALPR